MCVYIRFVNVVCMYVQYFQSLNLYYIQTTVTPRAHACQGLMIKMLLNTTHTKYLVGASILNTQQLQWSLITICHNIPSHRCVDSFTSLFEQRDGCPVLSKVVVELYAILFNDHLILITPLAITNNSPLLHAI